MADGEYTLDDAFSDLWAAGKELDGSGGRAETWIRLRIADLEAKAEVAAMIVRVAVTEVKPGDALVFTLREATDLEYDVYLHYLDALKQLVARELGHPVPVLLVDGADVSVLRAAEAAHRAVPMRDSHDLSPQIREDEPRSLFSTGGAGQHAPEHIAARVAQDGEAVCARPKYGADLTAGPVTDCARERWHTGPHMDITAIAHAGKAGEVWE